MEDEEDEEEEEEEDHIEMRNWIFFTISSLRRELSPTHAQVVRAKSCATHRALITCNITCNMSSRPKMRSPYL